MRRDVLGNLPWSRLQVAIDRALEHWVAANIAAINRALVAEIRAIEMRAARLVANQLAGQYHSIFRGRGLAFSEVREYLPGDDIRRIDWNVSARMNAPHVKLFVEERDRTVLLLVDMSASSWFGSHQQSKREICGRIAALVAFAAITNRDRVGLVIFTDRVERFVAAKKGRKHVLRVIREILSYQPVGRGTNIAEALDFLSRISRRRSVAFVLSDFLSSDWEPAMRIACRRNDMIPVVIRDPLENGLPPLGLCTVEDLETGARHEFDTNGPEGQHFAAYVIAQDVKREQCFRRLGLTAVDVRTDEAYEDALIRFFQARSRESRRRRK